MTFKKVKEGEGGEGGMLKYLPACPSVTLVMCNVIMSLVLTIFQRKTSLNMENGMICSFQ